MILCTQSIASKNYEIDIDVNVRHKAISRLSEGQGTMEKWEDAAYAENLSLAFHTKGF